MNHFLRDHFRCPELNIEFEVSSSRHSNKGYFQFGDDVVCYTQSGALPLAENPDDRLHDALNEARVDGARCVLPFDPAQTIDNLRRERYAKSLGHTGEHSSFQHLIRRAYYVGRPYLPVPVRKHLQRVFLARRTHAGFPDWPVDVTVDRLLDKLLALCMRARGVDRLPFIWFWPEGHTAAAVMTHDVEMRDGLLSCSALMDLDERYGVRASFQFIPEDRYTIPQSLLQEIRHRGFEVNIHDLNHDGRLYWSREEFLRRASRINQYAQDFRANGFRAGVLYRNLEWYDALDFPYDMSVPNVGHLSAQAGGCCTVMPYFVGRILELPLTTTEDYLLFQILGEYSTTLWQLQTQLVLDRHGLMSFLIHPDYLDNQRATETYSALLNHLSRLHFEAGLWLALPGEVNEWWRARSQMTLVQREGTWRIEGLGSERARIAYAHLEGEGVRYTLDHDSRQATTSWQSTPSADLSRTVSEGAQSPVSTQVSLRASRAESTKGRTTDCKAPGRSDFSNHMAFALLCMLSGLALSRSLGALARLAYHSEYYSHIVVIPLLAGYIIFLKRKNIFVDSKPHAGTVVPLLGAGLLLFALGKWGWPSMGAADHLSLSILSLVLLWIGSFGLCYGSLAFRAALFPLLLLPLMVPLPLSVMDGFVHVTRVGSADVASAIFSVFGVPVLRDAFLFVLPGLSIEVAKECSGIHSTIALFVLTLMCAYIFLPSIWRRVLLLLFVFPIVSFTNGLRIATLSLLAEYVDRNIMYSSLHRDGGILFFLLAFGLMLAILRLLSAPHDVTGSSPTRRHRTTPSPGEAGIAIR